MLQACWEVVAFPWVTFGSEVLGQQSGMDLLGMVYGDNHRVTNIIVVEVWRFPRCLVLWRY